MRIIEGLQERLLYALQIKNCACSLYGLLSKDFKGGAMSSPWKLGQVSCDIFPQRTAVRRAARAERRE